MGLLLATLLNPSYYDRRKFKAFDTENWVRRIPGATRYGLQDIPLENLRDTLIY
jgi:hypothetical protein